MRFLVTLCVMIGVTAATHLEGNIGLEFGGHGYGYQGVLSNGVDGANYGGAKGVLKSTKVSAGSAPAGIVQGYSYPQYPFIRTPNAAQAVPFGYFNTPVDHPHYYSSGFNRIPFFPFNQPAFNGHYAPNGNFYFPGSAEGFYHNIHAPSPTAQPQHINEGQVGYNSPVAYAVFGYGVPYLFAKIVPVIGKPQVDNNFQAAVHPTQNAGFTGATSSPSTTQTQANVDLHTTGGADIVTPSTVRGVGNVAVSIGGIGQPAHSVGEITQVVQKINSSGGVTAVTGTSA